MPKTNETYSKTPNQRPKKHRKTSPAKITASLLLALGLTALALSIVYESTILAFIGLGLTFWGTTLLYISPEKHIKKTLLDATITPSLSNLDKILTELEYQGKGIYLPPKYLKDFETSKIYIPKHKNTKLPTPETIQQQEDKTFLTNPQAALVNPPGAYLSKLYEKTLRTNFTQIDLNSLQQKLPKLFIEDLEIAENIEIKTPETLQDETQKENNIIYTKITNSTYKDICKETKKLTNIHNSIGCPLCSSIAIALTKTTGKPITIKKTEISNDEKTIEAHYQIIKETRWKPKVSIEKSLQNTLAFYRNKS